MNNSLNLYNQYFQERDKPTITLAERLKALNKSIHGQFNVNKLVIIYKTLLEEKQNAEIQYIQANEAKNKLLGTGLGGISAQMNYEMACKRYSTYEDWQFEKLKYGIIYALHIKYNKICDKVRRCDSLNSVETAYFKLGEPSYKSLQNNNQDEFLKNLQKLSILLGKVSISLSNIETIMTK